jgi:hypothetical protein
MPICIVTEFCIGMWHASFRTDQMTDLNFRWLVGCLFEKESDEIDRKDRHHA